MTFPNSILSALAIIAVYSVGTMVTVRVRAGVEYWSREYMIGLNHFFFFAQIPGSLHILPDPLPIPSPRLQWVGFGARDHCWTGARARMTHQPQLVRGWHA